MKYMLLIYDDEQVWAKLSASEQQRLFGEYMAFTESIKASGNYISGEPLQPIATATSLKIRNDKQLVTDGPFAETQEQLGGYYLVNARDLDEAEHGDGERLRDFPHSTALRKQYLVYLTLTGQKAPADQMRNEFLAVRSAS